MAHSFENLIQKCIVYIICDYLYHMNLYTPFPTDKSMSWGMSCDKKKQKQKTNIKINKTKQHKTTNLNDSDKGDKNSIQIHKQFCVYSM